MRPEDKIHSQVNRKSWRVWFPGGSDGEESAHHARDPGSIPQSGRSLGEGNGYPLQNSYLENSMDRGAWWATVRGVPCYSTQGCKESDITEQLMLSLSWGTGGKVFLFRTTWIRSVICFCVLDQTMLSLIHQWMEVEQNTTFNRVLKLYGAWAVTFWITLRESFPCGEGIWTQLLRCWKYQVLPHSLVWIMRNNYNFQLYWGYNLKMITIDSTQDGCDDCKSYLKTFLCYFMPAME